jgi:hypothetical protein
MTLQVKSVFEISAENKSDLKTKDFNIYSLFNYADNRSVHTASNYDMINEQRRGKYVEESSRGLI